MLMFYAPQTKILEEGTKDRSCIFLLQNTQKIHDRSFVPSSKIFVWGAYVFLCNNSCRDGLTKHNKTCEILTRTIFTLVFYFCIRRPCKDHWTSPDDDLERAKKCSDVPFRCAMVVCTKDATPPGSPPSRWYVRCVVDDMCCRRHAQSANGLAHTEWSPL
jgi:hypothetical protein